MTTILWCQHDPLKPLDGMGRASGCIRGAWDYAAERGSGCWGVGVMRYRICKNEAPHNDDWWTVEYETEKASGVLWWKKTETVWSSVKEPNPYSSPATPPCYWVRTRRFDAPETAQKYIDQAKRPRTHVCGDPQ